jgi:UDP-N-acetylglucosamine 4-epimerase
MTAGSDLAQSIKNHRFLVTGGAGFIGSHLVEFLLRNGAGRVRVLDNLSTGSMDNLKDLQGHPGFEWLEGDIRNPDDCIRAVHDIDLVSHQAALGSVPRSIKDPLITNQVNVGGTLNILEAAKNAGVKRLVYAASSSTYGDHPDLPKREENIGNPLSPYAVTKYVNEIYASVYSRVYQFHTIGLRYFNVFGPRQNPKGPYAAVIPLFIESALHGRPPVIYGDGTNSRDFTYVENAVQANIRALLLPELNGHEVVNIACGASCSLNQLWELICHKTGKKILPIYKEARQGDVKHSLAAISKAKALLGYVPEFDLENGLEKAIAWYKARKD